MKTSLTLALAASSLLIAACQQPTSTVAVPVPVAVPGPAGAPGAPGEKGDPGNTGRPGSDGSTVIVVPEPQS